MPAKSGTFATLAIGARFSRPDQPGYVYEKVEPFTLGWSGHCNALIHEAPAGAFPLTTLPLGTQVAADTPVAPAPKERAQ